MHSCIPQTIYTLQSKFILMHQWLYSLIAISMNVTDMIANDIKQCVWVIIIIIDLGILNRHLNECLHNYGGLVACQSFNS